MVETDSLPFQIGLSTILACGNKTSFIIKAKGVYFLQTYDLPSVTVQSFSFPIVKIYTLTANVYDKAVILVAVPFSMTTVSYRVI